MTTRKLTFKPSAQIAPCPKCGNSTDFTVHSEQVAEDGCEVWAVCRCDHQAGPEHHYEDMMGGVHDENVHMAMSCWNDAFATA